MAYSQRGQCSLPCLHLRTIEKDYQREGPQLPEMMWSQLWCLLLVGNGAGAAFLIVLRLCRESSGLLLPPEVWLPARQLQHTPRPWRAVRRDRAGPSGHALSAECFQYSELLLLGVHKKAFIEIGIKFGQPSKVRAKQILPSWRAALTCALCINSTPLAFSLLH